MKVLHDLVLILPNKEEESVLNRPESSKEIPQEGKVVAIGPSVTEIKKLDNVVYRKWSGDLINFDGTDYIMVKSEDVLMIIKK